MDKQPNTLLSSVFNSSGIGSNPLLAIYSNCLYRNLSSPILAKAVVNFWSSGVNPKEEESAAVDDEDDDDDDEDEEENNGTREKGAVVEDDDDDDDDAGRRWVGGVNA